MIATAPQQDSSAQIPVFAQALGKYYPESFKRVQNAIDGKDAVNNELGISVAQLHKAQRALYPERESATGSDRFVTLSPVDAYLVDLLKKNNKVQLADQLLALNFPYAQKLGFKHTDLNVLSSFVSKHPLINFIAKSSPLTEEDYISILKSGFVDLHILRKDDEKVSSGVLEASQGPSHGDYAWTRDMVAVALGKLEIGNGQAEFAEKIAHKLYQAYSNKAQRDRINNLIGDSSKWNPGGINDIPHVRFKVETVTDEEGKITDYKLVDCDQDWGMKQLDAYGYFLQLLGRLACKNPGLIKSWDEEAKEDPANKDLFFNSNNSPKATESTLVAFVNMLHSIKYWELADVGAWESDWESKRASSLTACISGLKWVYKYFKENGDFNEAPVDVNNEYGLNLTQFKERLEECIQEGNRVLFSNRIPKKSELANNHLAKAKELDEDSNSQKHVDSALLFSLVLSDPDMISEDDINGVSLENKGLSEDQHFSIFRTTNVLRGEIGQARSPKDNYMGMNWTTDKHGGTKYKEHAENSFPDYKPAEWAFFDPYKASYFYERFIKSITDEQGELDKTKEPDIESFLIADRFARRSLAMISKTNYSFFRQGYERQGAEEEDYPASYIKVPAGEAMEHYWYSTKDLRSPVKNEYSQKELQEKQDPESKGKWMPGENYRLNWTKIALQKMFYKGSKAGKLLKELLPNEWNKKPISGLDMSMAIKKGLFPIWSNTNPPN